MLAILLFFSQFSVATNYPYTVYLNSNGNDSNTGRTAYEPVKSMARAQALLDTFMGYFLPNSQNKNDQFYMKIVASGIFYGQSFQWNHPHKNVHFEMVAERNGDAEFYGYRHPDFNNPNGISFFDAYSEKSIFKSYKGFTGYGSVVLRNLVVKYYGSAFNIAAWPDTKPGKVEITGNTFYRIGQFVNPSFWSPRYSAVMLKNVDRALISNNVFMQIQNITGPELVHGIYIKSCDNSQIVNNTFNSISGEPVKLRDGSDFNNVSSNIFVKSSASVHIFPVQNWYDFWYKSDEETGATRELPSLGNKLDNNSYLNGYANDVSATSVLKMSAADRSLFCANRTIASPDLLPASYESVASQAKTHSRLIINGQKRYHTDWYNACSSCEKSSVIINGNKFNLACGTCTGLDGSYGVSNKTGSRGQVCKQKYMGPVR